MFSPLNDLTSFFFAFWLVALLSCPPPIPEPFSNRQNKTKQNKNSFPAPESLHSFEPGLGLRAHWSHATHWAHHARSPVLQSELPGQGPPGSKASAEGWHRGHGMYDALKTSFLSICSSTLSNFLDVPVLSEDARLSIHAEGWLLSSGYVLLKILYLLFRFNEDRRFNQRLVIYFANYCFDSSFLQIIKWFSWHSVSTLLKQVILKKKEMLFFWITAQELLLSSSLSRVSGCFARRLSCSSFWCPLWSGGACPWLVGVLTTLPLEAGDEEYILCCYLVDRFLGFNWIGEKSLQVMNFAEQQFFCWKQINCSPHSGWSLKVNYCLSYYNLHT